MNKLREIRQASGYSQEKIAEMLKTTQQSVARWEAGKSEPSISALRDLSMIFGTSIDDLIGKNPFSDTAMTNRYFSLDNGDGHFWGHFGIKFSGDAFSRWYPITLQEANRVSNAIANISPDLPWLCITTLNNRSLLLNISTPKSIYLLDDNADQLHDDWELTWDAYNGYPLEVYRALADWFVDRPTDCSESFISTVEGIINEEQLDEDKIETLIINTLIHYKDGTIHSLQPDEEKLWDAMTSIEYEQPQHFDLSSGHNGLNVYIPTTHISMVDMPLYQVINAAKRDELEFDEENASI